MVVLSPLSRQWQFQEPVGSTRAFLGVMCWDLFFLPGQQEEYLLSGSGLTLLQLCSRTGLPQPARVWPGDGAERQPTMWAGCLEAQFSPSSTGMARVAPKGC